MQSVSFFAFPLTAGVLALVLGIPLIALCRKLKIVSATDFRRKSLTIPLVGGLCIYLSALTATVLYGYDAKLFLFALPILVLGVLDDRFELRAWPKFAVQVVSVGGWLYAQPVGGLILERAGVNHWSAMLLTGFWMCGLINAMNMIDGMDGVATSFCAIAAAGLIALTPESADTPQLVAITGACLGFLWYNLPRAKAYLGDAGSTTLGFLLGAAAATQPLPQTGHEYIPALFVFAFPLMDAVLSMLRRFQWGSNLFKGDRDHLHHKLLKLGFSVPQALMIICGAAIFCSGAAYLTAYRDADPFLLRFALLLTAPATLLGAVFYLEGRLARQISMLSKSLIPTHLPVEPSIAPQGRKPYAVAIDLVTYYKELQNRGFIEVNGFISDLGTIVRNLPGNAKCNMAGSYTVILLFEQASSFQAARTELVSEFASLLDRLELKKTGDKIPLGVKFFVPDTPDYKNLMKYYETEETPVRIRRAG